MKKRWIAQALIYSGLIYLLLITSTPFAYAQEPTITPSHLTFILPAGDCQIESVTVQTAAATSLKLDLVFVVDVTGSMQGIIDEVTTHIQPIVAGIRDLVPDTHFALATVADYPSPDRDIGIKPWTLPQNFTTDTTLLLQALRRLRLYSSGDDEEAYLRALYETQSLNWRPEARRLVLLFGDAPAHLPDPGLDGRLGTSDDLTQRQVVDLLNEAHITVLATSRRTPAFFRNVTKATGGHFFVWTNAGQITKAIQTLLDQVNDRRIQQLTLSVPEERMDWLSWRPTIHSRVKRGEQRSFRLRICVPTGTQAGHYTFSTEPIGAGSSVNQLVLDITVPPQIDLSLSQMPLTVPVSLGNIISYQLHTLNHGVDTAQAITLTVGLPRGVQAILTKTENCRLNNGIIQCALQTLVPGEEISTTIEAEAIRSGNWKLFAEVSATERDIDRRDNLVVTQVTILPVESQFRRDSPATDTGPQSVGSNVGIQDEMINQSPTIWARFLARLQWVNDIWFVALLLLLPFIELISLAIYEKVIDSRAAKNE